MARGGYRANAGRPLGSRSEKTVERENTVKAEKLRERGVKSDLAAMLEMRDYWLGVAGQEQRRVAEDTARYNQKMIEYEKERAALPPDERKKLAEPERPSINLDLMTKALGLAGDMASKRAPYLHHRLQAMVVRDDPLDLTRLTDAELDQLESLYKKADIARSASDGTGETQH